MKRAQWLLLIALVTVAAAVSSTHTGLAAGGCFTFQNSTPVFFDDGSGGIGQYQCASTSPSTCTDCIDIEPGYQIRECVFTDDDDSYCDYYDD